MILLNGKEVAFTPGQTILELAQANDIEIPTLCHDERIEPYGPSRLEATAAHYGLRALGQLPIDARFATICDKGTAETDLPDGLLPDAIAAITKG